MQSVEEQQRWLEEEEEGVGARCLSEMEMQRAFVECYRKHIIITAMKDKTRSLAVYSVLMQYNQSVSPTAPCPENKRLSTETPAVWKTSTLHMWFSLGKGFLLLRCVSFSDQWALRAMEVWTNVLSVHWDVFQKNCSFRIIGQAASRPASSWSPRAERSLITIKLQMTDITPTLKV